MRRAIQALRVTPSRLARVFAARATACGTRQAIGFGSAGMGAVMGLGCARLQTKTRHVRHSVTPWPAYIALTPVSHCPYMVFIERHERRRLARLRLSLAIGLGTSEPSLHRARCGAMGRALCPTRGTIMRQGEVWSFGTKRFRVVLEVERQWNYQYDGDEEGGETQAKLDSGEFVAFDSRIVVYFDGEAIGSDDLGGSVYGSDNYREFWQAHRGRDPLNRNCTLMRRAWRGGGDPEAAVSICHYFPEMVRNAVRDARAAICRYPRMRCAVEARVS